MDDFVSKPHNAFSSETNFITERDRYDYSE